MPNATAKRAFTLIELLVVIAIIAILAAILFPVFAQAKTAAKRSADLSNVKQITLGAIQYMGDSDDVPPLMQQVPRGAIEFSPTMISWKDSLSPYIKGGGKPYNNGQKYSQTSGGGVFESPLADAPWSSQGPIQGNEGWTTYDYPAMNGGTGDSTTRFARSYALNRQAGSNEMDKGKGIIGATKEEANGTVTFTWDTTPASATVLANPANTLFLIPTRTYLPWVGPEMIHATCSAQGLPTTSDLCCIQGTKNRNLTGGFFDGHVKNVFGPSTNAKDMWGYYEYMLRRFPRVPNLAADDAKEAMRIKEWRG